MKRDFCMKKAIIRVFEILANITYGQVYLIWQKSLCDIFTKSVESVV